MQDRSAFALKVFAVSLFLGVLGDLLLRNTPWGLNFPIWILLSGICAAGLLRKSPVSVPRATLWMALPVAVFSACFFWRDADQLKIANGTAAFLAVGVLALRARKGKPALGGIMEYTLNIAFAWINFTSDFAHLISKDIVWNKGPKTAARFVAVVRGLLLALPLLLVFGGLFASADVMFSKSLRDTFTFDLGDVFGNVAVFAVVALLVGGLFRRLFLGVDSPPQIPKPETPKWPLIGAVELATVFGLLDVLFVAFVAVQFKYFFGGHAHVASIAGVSFAEYARSGFFELTAVAALSLVVVLGAHALLPEGDKRTQRLFSGLAAVLVMCVFIVLLSAVERMNLYVGEYGLSELRLFTTSFIVWLAVALAWLTFTVMRHKRERFAFGALMAGYAVILGLNFVNPDGLIARVNMSTGKALDVGYITSLSVDAAPAVVEKLDHLPPATRDELKAKLRDGWSQRISEGDWRSMNLSRTRYLADYQKSIRGN